MDGPTSRSLRLLSLLQTGRPWTVEELSRRLSVAPRTVRRDVARLRQLGYDIAANPGPGGAYRLMPGTKIPPLLLDADEVCTLVTGLLVLEAEATDDTAATVRTKLEQLLPPSLRRRAVATAASTQVLTTAGLAHWPSLGLLADAISNGEHVEFTYTDQHGRQSYRRVEPYRQVLRAGTWYLIAYDTRRRDWRLFRLDRVHEPSLSPAPSGYEPQVFLHPSIERWLATDFGRCTPHAI